MYTLFAKSVYTFDESVYTFDESVYTFVKVYTLFKSVYTFDESVYTFEKVYTLLEKYVYIFSKVYTLSAQSVYTFDKNVCILAKFYILFGKMHTLFVKNQHFCLKCMHFPWIFVHFHLECKYFWLKIFTFLKTYIDSDQKSGHFFLKKCSSRLHKMYYTKLRLCCILLDCCTSHQELWKCFGHA